MLVTLLGGVSFRQVVCVEAVVLGECRGRWEPRHALGLCGEKTFQALATTLLAIVLWLGIGEALAAGAFGSELWGVPTTTWATLISPSRDVIGVRSPFLERSPGAVSLLGMPCPRNCSC